MEEIKCSKIQLNKMACSRKATHFKQGDPENKYAMCSVCYALEGKPKGYQDNTGQV